MKKPPLPKNEEARLKRLEAYGLIYSPAEERFDRITRLARDVFNVPIALVSLVSSRCQWFKSSQGLMAPETPREISFCGHAILNSNTLVIPDTLANPDFADNPLVTGDPYIRFYAGHPLTYQGCKLGTLCIIDRVPRALKPSELDTLRSMAAWAENEIKVSTLSEAQTELLTELDEVRRQALIDPLTKTWNRRGLDKVLRSELERAGRQQHPICIMLIDIDYFKKVNDRHGHSVGDMVLREVAQRIRSSLRPQDLVARYGGDEFFVLLTGGDERDARYTAARILARVNDEPVEAGDTVVNVGLSIGGALAQVTPDFDLKKFIAAADETLYEAKGQGRGCLAIKKYG
jgi:diguanylate cyclase (GGDEF)-like protein